MPGAHYVVERWWTLSRDELADEVRHTVRSGGAEAQKIWDAVLTDKKLAARVRGILSSLRTQMKSHRDAAMWEVWIGNARRALTPPAKEETPPASGGDNGGAARAEVSCDDTDELVQRLAAMAASGPAERETPAETVAESTPTRNPFLGGADTSSADKSQSIDRHTGDRQQENRQAIRPVPVVHFSSPE